MIHPAQIWGIAAVAGIGFTVSIFVTQLAYQESKMTETAKLGNFAGSILSATFGARILIAYAQPAPGRDTEPQSGEADR